MLTSRSAEEDSSSWKIRSESDGESAGPPDATRWFADPAPGSGPMEIRQFMKTMKRFDVPAPSDLPRHWVQAEEYLELAVSSRQLARCDEPENGIRGLVDLSTGERFFVREEQALLSDLGINRPRGAVSERQPADV